MRRAILLLTAMAVVLVVVGGVALAVSKTGTNGADTLKGDDTANDRLAGGAGTDTCIVDAVDPAPVGCENTTTV